jgi:hypothetical protein
MNTNNTLIELPHNNKFTIGHNYLTVNGDVTNDEWKEAFGYLLKLNESVQWIIGDFLNAIEAAGKDILTTIGDEVGFDYKSMLNMKNVAKKIPQAKRVEGVSWSHHREAYTETKNVDAMIDELQLAKRNNLSVQKLRENIRSKVSDVSMTHIPEVQHSKEDTLYSEALGGITSIKRFINNGYNKVSAEDQSQFLTEWKDLVSLVDSEVTE